MQLFHFIAAWLFPDAVSAAAKVTKAMTVKSSSEPDNASSPSVAFSVKAADDSGSSISSSSSSSSSDDHPRFFASRNQQQQSPLASPLCFGAGGGALRLLRGSRGARARSPTKHEAAAAAAAAASKAPAPIKGDVVGRYLRKISRRLRKARAAASKESPPSPGGGAGDDTPRERAEAVARAISYCKDTLRRGAPPPSPSLAGLLHGRQHEIVASCDGSADSKTPPPRPRLDGSLAAARRGIECGTTPRPHRAGGGLAEMQATSRPSPSRDSWITASGSVHGKELPRHGHNAIMDEPAVSSSPGDLAADEMGMPGSFDEMEFLKIFDGDEEMIGHHFITVQT